MRFSELPTKWQSFEGFGIGLVRPMAFSKVNQQFDFLVKISIILKSRKYEYVECGKSVHFRGQCAPHSPLSLSAEKRITRITEGTEKS